MARSSTSRVRYRVGGAELLPLVGPLWNKLRQHHVDHSRHFADVVAQANFEGRCREIIGKVESDGVHVTLAIDRASGEAVGYCISSITPKGAAELESIFVEKGFRQQGVGMTLAKRGLAWMRRRGAKSFGLYVVAGNEQALGFHERLGFYPRTIILARRHLAKHAK